MHVSIKGVVCDFCKLTLKSLIYKTETIKQKKNYKRHDNTKKQKTKLNKKSRTTKTTEKKTEKNWKNTNKI